MKKRGFTMVELLIAATIGALISGILGYSYVWVANRAAATYSSQATLVQAVRLEKEIETTMANAVSCTRSANAYGDTLTCMMPENAIDTNADTVADKWEPVGVNARSLLVYGANGKRITYYFSDGSGNYTAPAGFAKPQLYRAIRPDSSPPVNANLDPTFRNYEGGGYKWGLISSVTYGYNAGTKVGTFSITARSLDYAARTAATSSARTRELVLTRRVFTPNWRK